MDLIKNVNIIVTMAAIFNVRHGMDKCRIPTTSQANPEYQETKMMHGKCKKKQIQHN